MKMPEVRIMAKRMGVDFFGDIKPQLGEFFQR